MSDTFTRFDSEILRNGKHFADVVDAEGAETVLSALQTCPLQSFDRAQAIGERVWNRWQLISGKEPPMDMGDMAWADIVQFIVRMARDPGELPRMKPNAVAPEGVRATYNDQQEINCANQ